jgi:hypothetical protein
MYTLMRDGLSARSARLQLPSLAITVVVAETFYKFHSFTLEFLVALATWTVVDLALNVVARGLAALRVVAPEARPDDGTRP